ncbi:conserved hypothetical protein [Leishmania major strain Friedlin]|uniref:Cilia- and flagella-associated protein 58 central coiled coil domain-containing protein n=1 Tax=Leishmania major TaxID=5664 RepID=E9ACH7_LEIMA|nr:conserved hypothetical protein [Leishmania major strain Friedlin]CAG9567257.1 hypothetical_protein_-_conserved [Leishmania major strain Friedlin]CBZ11994.1 conserved hypothetical protein [Leishmania major strain Friedlin]|eukprot:XP_003721708.1 conserved hypothetical protein [Leishmania major strain Friedlin]
MSSGGGEASARPPPSSSHGTPAADTGGAAKATDGTQGSLSPVELEAIEQRFVEVLRALTAEPQLEPFRNEYEKLHRLLLSSHDGEQRLLRQARELRDELDTHHQQITTAMQLSQEDEEAIRTLRGEIEAAWAKADTAHEQEQRSRELLHTLRQQVTELDAMVEKTAGLSMGQEAYLRDLLTVKKDREEEAMLLHAALNRTEADHRQVCVQLAAAKQAHEAAQRERDEQRQVYQHLLTSLEAEQRERAAKEASVRQYRDTTELCMRRLDERGVEVERAIREEKKAAKEAEGTAQEIQAIARQLQERQERFGVEAARLAAAERENTILTRELPQRQAALHEQQDELKREEKQLHLLEKSARAQQAELAALVEKRATAAAAVQTRANSVDAALTELATEEKARAALEEAVAKEMQRKTNTMHTNTFKATASSKVEGQRVMEAGKSRRLHQQLELLRTENEKMRKEIYYAEQNHEKNTKEAQQALLNYHRTLDAIRTRRSEAKAVEEDIALHQKKLKAQQALLSTVTADRQKTEKALRETEAELLLLRNRHASKQEELESVKTELIQQEADMCQLHGLSRQLNKDVANTEQRLRFLREDQQHAESRVEALRSEAQELRQVIAQYDLEAQQQGTRLKYMTHERNAIATQLLLRSEELELIREKIRLADATRVSGTTKYQRAMKQLLESRDLLVEQRLRCRIALVRLRYLDRLHTKEVHQEKLLSQSRARVRALADELGTKHNVHCWRSMESNAPEVLDALAKVQLLQAKLLRKHGELKEKTDLVEKEERAYQQLRQKLARMPGPEAAEELALCAENMQQRKAQLLCMTDSLAEAEQEAEVLEVHVAQLQEELQDLKHRYYQEKTKHAALRQEEKLVARTWGAGGAGAARQAGSGTGSSVGDGDGAVVAAGASAPSAEQRRTNTDDRSPSAGGPASADVEHRSASQPQQPHSHAGGSAIVSNSHNGVQAAASGTGRMSAANSGRVGNGSVPPRNGRRRAPLAEAILDTLTAGPPQPNFPLQRPPHQRQFVGGGFSLTR